MQYRYSQEFQEIISSPGRLKDLLVNCSFNGTFEGWERRKAFIAAAIHKSGTFLDIGSGNGFLLRCLQEWSEFDITTYGIDVSEDYIKEARELFPGQQDNFAVLNLQDIGQIGNYLPDEYDFVYFSQTWTADDIDYWTVDLLGLFQNYVTPGGRLIVGFYNHDFTTNRGTLERLFAFGIRFDQIIYNPRDTNLVALKNAQ